VQNNSRILQFLDVRNGFSDRTREAELIYANEIWKLASYLAHAPCESCDVPHGKINVSAHDSKDLGVHLCRIGSQLRMRGEKWGKDRFFSAKHTREKIDSGRAADEPIQAW